MPFLEECEEFFGTRDLYSVLEVPKNASSSEIKKAYRKLSLKVHPDRADEDDKENATAKFQVFGKVYSILSDDDRKEVYDETGCVDDEIDDKILNWSEFWASVFPGINETMINEYTDKYWGSKKEEEDLKERYKEYKGDMNKIMDSMYCRTLEHEARFCENIKKWIDSGEVPSYRAFTHETAKKKQARKRKCEKEKKEWELVQKNAKTFQQEIGDSVSSIESIIAKRNEERSKRQDEFLDKLAAKYSKPKKPRKQAAAASGVGSSKKRSKKK